MWPTYTSFCIKFTTNSSNDEEDSSKASLILFSFIVECSVSEAYSTLDFLNDRWIALSLNQHHIIQDCFLLILGSGFFKTFYLYSSINFDMVVVRNYFGYIFY